MSRKKSDEKVEFRDASRHFNQLLTKEVRQTQGIFFTPQKARQNLFSVLATLGIQPKRILEPSFGTGEFILDALSLYPEATIIGVEKNEELFRSVTCTNVELHCADFTKWEGCMNTQQGNPASTQQDENRCDLIIGNPPYFVMDTIKEEKARYMSCMIGRPNIYVWFIYKCLTQHLKEDGYLAFIIPTSLCNSSYYQPMRKYISEHTTIRWMEVLNKPGFFETGQDTMLLVVQKNKHNSDYLFYGANGSIYMTPHYRELTELTQGATTLRELGVACKTGSVVWNQVKDKLTGEAQGNTLLIYAANIKGGVLHIGLPEGEKKQYVKLQKEPISGPVILLDRGYGNHYQFNAVLVEEKNFYAENHVNVIYVKEGSEEERREKLKRIMESFQEDRSGKFVEYFVGNGALSATEMETLFPIF